jgi:hypothetical protein
MIVLCNTNNIYIKKWVVYEVPWGCGVGLCVVYKVIINLIIATDKQFDNELGKPQPGNNVQEDPELHLQLQRYDRARQFLQSLQGSQLNHQYITSYSE